MLMVYLTTVSVARVIRRQTWGRRSKDGWKWPWCNVMHHVDTGLELRTISARLRKCSGRKLKSAAPKWK